MWELRSTKIEVTFNVNKVCNQQKYKCCRAESSPQFLGKNGVVQFRVQVGIVALCSRLRSRVLHIWESIKLLTLMCTIALLNNSQKLVRPSIHIKELLWSPLSCANERQEDTHRAINCHITFYSQVIKQEKKKTPVLPLISACQRE